MNTNAPRIVVKISMFNSKTLKMVVTVNNLEVANLCGEKVTVLETHSDGKTKQTLLITHDDEDYLCPTFSNIGYILFGRDVKLIKTEVLDNGIAKTYGVMEGQ